MVRLALFAGMLLAVALITTGCTESVVSPNDKCTTGSDINCGGSCPNRCADNLHCNVGSDCQSAVCTLGLCAAPICNDGVKNGDESDIDCGGGCDPCGDGLACTVDADCLDQVCRGGLCLPKDAPIAQDLSLTTNKGEALTVVFSSEDPAGLSLTYAVLTQPAQGVLHDAIADHVTYVPLLGWSGTDTFTYSASNGTLSSNPATVTIAVVNRPPKAVDVTPQTFKNHAIQIAIDGSDADGDDLTFSLPNGGGPAHGVASLDEQVITYTPATGFVGLDQIVFRVSDGEATADGTVTVVVVDRAPLASDAEAATDRETAIDIALAATDPDGDDVTFALGAGPQAGTATINGATAHYVPDGVYVGDVTFTFQALDGQLASNAATVRVHVKAFNRPPSAGEVRTRTLVNVPKRITLPVSDPDGDPLTVTIVQQPAHGTVNLDGRTVTYTPAPDFTGNDLFTYQVSDGVATTAPAQVSILVVEQNTPPTCSGGEVTVPKNTTATYWFPCSDADGDFLFYTLVGGASHGATVMLGTWRDRVGYAPNPDYEGDDSFTFVASDGVDTSTTATVTLHVVNGKPVADELWVRTLEGAALAVRLGGRDPDDDAITYQTTSVPSYGILDSVSGNTVVYHPNPGYTGEDSFQYKVQDSEGLDSDVATVTISVGGKLIYVNHAAGGDHNGTSWANAFTDLQDAIAASEAGDEIWVAKGIYKPTSGSDTQISFAPKEKTALYGGFAGGESTREARDWAANQTALSGALGCDETQEMGTETNPCYREYDQNSNPVRPGFTGAQTGNYLVIPASDVVLDGLWIQYGGSMWAGGGLNAHDIARLTIANCTIYRNGQGRGLYAVNVGAFAMTDTAILENAHGWEGGIGIGGNTVATLRRCRFNGNQSWLWGGALRTNDSAHVRIFDTTFENSRANCGGGVILAGNTSTVELSGTMFIGNSTSSWGGVILTDEGNPGPTVIVSNSVFAGNGALANYDPATPNPGGAIYARPGAKVIIRSSTFTGNSGSPGGAIYGNDANVVVDHSIFWGNTGQEFAPGTYASSLIMYSLIQSLPTESVYGVGNIDGDPLFVDADHPNGADGIPRTADDGLRLTAGSPCIDTGLPMPVGAYDILGFGRPYPVGGKGDMGAYEWHP